MATVKQEKQESIVPYCIASSFPPHTEATASPSVTGSEKPAASKAAGASEPVQGQQQANQPQQRSSGWYHTDKVYAT